MHFEDGGRGWKLRNWGVDCRSWKMQGNGFSPGELRGNAALWKPRFQSYKAHFGLLASRIVRELTCAVVSQWVCGQLLQQQHETNTSYMRIYQVWEPLFWSPGLCESTEPADGYFWFAEEDRLGREQQWAVTPSASIISKATHAIGIATQTTTVTFSLTMVTVKRVISIACGHDRRKE